MPAKKPQVAARDTVNPFAYIEARKKAEADAKAAKEAKRKADTAKSRETVRTKSWYDYPFDVMRSVGDYMRGK